MKLLLPCSLGLVMLFGAAVPPQQPEKTLVSEWIGPPLVINVAPQDDLEADILNAMKLSLN